MQKFSETTVEPVAEGISPSRFLQALPYLIILMLTLVGIAYTSINKRPLVIYWEFLAVLTGVLCVIDGWRQAEGNRVRLIWTQVLHWAAFLGTMNLLIYTDVQQMLNADATGLAILLLLALGTFVAGVHTLSWQICVLGAVMALAVPAIAWIEESALILILAATAFIVLGSLFWWLAHRRIAAPKLRNASADALAGCLESTQ